MFLALNKNNHVYPINKNLEKLSHLQDEKDVSLSAPSNFYINDKTEPPKFKMSYRRTAENERKFVSWRPNLLCTNACRHEAHRLSWKNWKSLLAGLAETIAKPYDMCWHITPCFDRVHAHHHNCPLGMHMSYVHTYCVYYGGTPMRHRKTACFEALVLEPHFAQSCGRFLLLYCILGWQSSLQASFHWKMQNVKLPVSNTCRLHMFKQWSNLLSGPVKQGNKVSLWRHSENRGENAGVPPAPFKQCWFVREETKHTRISLATRVLNIAKLGSKGSQAEAHGIYKGKKRA